MLDKSVVELVENKNGKYFDIKIHDNTAIDIDPKVKTKPIFEGDSLRKIILRKKPKDGYFVSTLKNVTHNIIPKIEGKDRGHLIADSFKNYLLTGDEIKEHQEQVNQFFGKGNNFNIRPQSPESNRNSVIFAGQLRFEQKVIDFLNTSVQGEVYYEIEETTFNEIFGRRIFIRFLKPEEEVDIHVFIPEDRYHCPNFL